MYYEENTKCQVLFPESWAVAVAENVISATDEQSGATEALSLMQATKELSEITATELTPLLRQNKNNFILNQFDNQKEKIVATCTYVLNNVQYHEDVYLFSANGIYYFLTFDYENGMIEESIPETCADSFKIFS